jgi:hypothetical protein
MASSVAAAYSLPCATVFSNPRKQLAWIICEALLELEKRISLPLDTAQVRIGSNSIEYKIHNQKKHKIKNSSKCFHAYPIQENWNKYLENILLLYAKTGCLNLMNKRLFPCLSPHTHIYIRSSSLISILHSMIRWETTCMVQGHVINGNRHQILKRVVFLSINFLWAQFIFVAALLLNVLVSWTKEKLVVQKGLGEGCTKTNHEWKHKKKYRKYRCCSGKGQSNIFLILCSKYSKKVVFFLM